MSEQQVRIVHLDPMRVVCFNGFGENPETLALEKLHAWAFAAGKRDLIFGYNNPNPSVGSPNYGYDAWMQVDQATPAPEGARLIDFPGGLYAVSRCIVVEPWQDIPSSWKALVAWVEASEYRPATHQWLEGHLDPQLTPPGAAFVLDLYMPVKA